MTVHNHSVDKFNGSYFLVRQSNLSDTKTVSDVKRGVKHDVALGWTGEDGIVSDGDHYYFYFLADGSETKFYLQSRLQSNRGKFDLYVNGILDSSGYDDYAAAISESYRVITLTQPIVPGFNEIELRINGKNALSSSYSLYIYGGSIT